MNIKQKFVLAISIILIISFTLVGVTYSYFITKSKNTKEKVVDDNLYVSYQDKNNLISLSNISDSIVVYKFIKLNSKTKLNYSIGITTNYDSIPFRDGITQEEVNTNLSLSLENPDGYYDNIYISMVLVNNINQNNLEESFTNGKIVFKEFNLIKDNKQILDKTNINGEKDYIVKIEYKNNPLLPVNILSNINILFNIYGVNIVSK